MQKITPKTVELKLTRMHGGKPWMTAFDNPFVQAAGRAIEQGFGQRPVFNREADRFRLSTFRKLGLPCVLFGVGLPDENAHAPDENSTSATSITALLRRHFCMARLGHCGEVKSHVSKLQTRSCFAALPGFDTCNL